MSKRKRNNKQPSYFFPTLSDHTGYVFYDSLETYAQTIENRSQRRWANDVIAQFNTDFITPSTDLRTNLKAYDSTIRYLERQQKYEREKELQILEKFYGIEKEQGEDLLGKNFDKLVIKSLNQIQNTLPSVQRSVRQIRKDLDEGKAKGLSSNKAFTSQAYQLQIAFDTELSQYGLNDKKDQVRRKLEKYITLHNDGTIKVDPLIQNAYQNSVVDILIKAMNRVADTVKDLNDQNQSVYDNLRQLQSILKANKKGSLAKSFIRYIKLPNLVAQIEAANGKAIAKAKKQHKKVSKKMIMEEVRVKGIDNKSQGFIEEIIASTLVPYLSGKNNSNTTAVTTRINGGQYASSDLVTVLARTDEVSIDFESIINNIFNSVSGRRKIQIRSSTKEAMDKIDSMNLSDYAIIYESTKSYTLGSVENSGFHGVTQKYASFVHALEQEGMFFRGRQGDLLLNSLINSLEGTYGYKQYGEKTQDWISKSLQRTFAAAMFDDPQTLESQIKSRGNVIHIFRLSGVVVPLSYLLTVAARAINETMSDAQGLKGRMQSPVKIEMEVGKDLFLSHEDNKGVNSKERWEKQQQQRDEKIIVSITFAQNFKKLLQGELGDYLI